MIKFKQVKKINKKLAKELLTMMKTDQKMRLRFIAGKGKMNLELDRKHTRRLKQIIKKHGWPIKSLVGKRASHAAWLLAQHADRDLRFQKKVLKMLNEIYENNKKEINPANIAYLMDRILMHEGKPQIFGTQLRRSDGKTAVPFPIKDKKNVNRRRKKYGLSTLEKYLKDYPKALEQWKKKTNK